MGAHTRGLPRAKGSPQLIYYQRETANQIPSRQRKPSKRLILNHYLSGRSNGHAGRCRMQNPRGPLRCYQICGSKSLQAVDFIELD
jgi:hypothetical protein